MAKNKTFPLNHSLAGASYAIYLAIGLHTFICNEGRKIGNVMTRRVAEKARSIIEN